MLCCCCWEKGKGKLLGLEICMCTGESHKIERAVRWGFFLCLSPPQKYVWPCVCVCALYYGIYGAILSTKLYASMCVSMCTFIQGFQSRYFVLRSKTLFYYKSQSEADSHPDKPLGVIPLKVNIHTTENTRRCILYCVVLCFMCLVIERDDTKSVCALLTSMCAHSNASSCTWYAFRVSGHLLIVILLDLQGALIEAPHGRSAQRPAFRLSFKEANVRRRRRGPLGRSQSVGSEDDGVAVKQAKYVLSATTVEEKVAWEDALREQIWKASTSDEDQEKKERRLSGIEKPDSYKPMNIQAVIEEDEEEEELDEDDDD